VTIRRTKPFEKQYAKLSPKVRKQFQNRLRLFVVNQNDPRLRVHALRAKYAGYWSFDVTGDVRALFSWDGEEIVFFAFIGTNSQLYG
jgi:mRNA-degrading endonuclease YafQ of YafQ-DinJ toxin-antitoxin module